MLFSDMERLQPNVETASLATRSVNTGVKLSSFGLSPLSRSSICDWDGNIFNFTKKFVLVKTEDTTVSVGDQKGKSEVRGELCFYNSLYFSTHWRNGEISA